MTILIERPPALDEFRRFFHDDVVAAMDEIDQTQRVPAELHRAAAAAGCYRLTVPVEHGGHGLSITAFLPYLEVAASGPGIGRMLVHTTNGVWRPLHQHGTVDQRHLVGLLADGDVVVAFALTEQAGGTGRDLHARAVRDGSGWRLTGEKHLITFADRSTHVILVVATDDRGQPDSLTTFVVPRETPGFEVDASQHTMGLDGTGHAFLRFDGMYLDDSARLGAVGAGLDVALSFLDYSRIALSGCMVGLARAALDEAVAFARRRTTFGRPIADRQAIQGHLAAMHADIEAGRHLVHHAAVLADAGAEFTAAAATAKLFCLEMVGRVTDLSLRVHGGWGYTRAAPIERIYRDARGFWFEEGTAEIQQLVVARHVLADA